MHIVIIGNGIAGVTCARHIRKSSQHSVTIISEESKYFYSRTALMYIYMGHMRFEDTKPYEDWFWKKNNIVLIQDKVVKILPNEKSIVLQHKGTILYDKLVIATGSSSNKMGWPGQDLPGVQGLYHLNDLRLMEQNTQNIKRAVIVGGGLIGIEMAEMLCSRNIPVTMLVRESGFWNNVLPAKSSEMINRHIAEHHIDLRLSTELKEIIPGNDGRVAAVVTKNDENIDCDFIGITVGVHPNIGFIQSSGIETDRGVLVNEYLETNFQDVYAAGDCAQFRVALPNRKAVEQVWYTGKMQGATVAQNICGQQTPYQPGHWFNSAKFFDIEYQTYGQVPNQLESHQAEFYWEHRDGKKSIHLVYDMNSLQFLGINIFGIRYRHHLFHQFLEEERSIKYVVEHLPAANFDPEFFATFDYYILSQYNLRFPLDKIQRQIKPGLNSFFQLLKKG
jgi:NAD(P)H-nitrite reductase large subunit